MFLALVVDTVTIKRRQVGSMVLLGVLTFHVAVAMVSAQSQETINATTGQQVSSLGSRLETLERSNLALRVGVLEESVGEMKWLIRGVTIAVIGQLILKLMENRRRQEDTDA